MGKKKRKIAEPAPVAGPLFDAHTHLASCGARTADEIAALMDRAAAAGVEGVCTVGDGMAETELAVAAADLHPRVWAAAAIHPTKADQLTDEAKARLTEMAQHPRVVAIGETGLDWYWLEREESTAPAEVQKQALRWHMQLAADVGKPLMIHNREADEALLEELDGYDNTVILHCFSSPFAVAEEALRRGYVLSFTGNVTFKRNDELRQAAAAAEAEQLLVETDAPYMTPEPYRGAKNESTFIGWQARCIAEVRGVAPEEMARQLTANAQRLYEIKL
ncbi:TatD family hydrolase [Corynebacterium sp. TAE3-ERU12]|uniref:TatD family hydrolase n=1 Tax=Corynebacterium sp. TAE3-ERU12 TaxID=2849491 RepID=UPI001C4533F2|nr:TatD family hydrolase [Corynebacterium sp. TAE3-ERU12]MBV7295621.1 TatD family hydrolase [Corynebacterium sp. TAE3-ERU12]